MSLVTTPALGATPSNSSTSNNPFDPAFARFANDVLKQWNVPGISLAVVDGGQIYSQGYGFATLPDTAVTPDTLFYAGSTTKAFTAATLAHLIDSNNYTALSKRWSTPISSIIHDDFVLQDAWSTAHITLEDAAVHRTGMPRHDYSWAKQVQGRSATPRDVVRNFRNLPQNAEPRTRFQYCNLMYVTLSYVIEFLTEKPLQDAMRDVIWGPLQMDATFSSLEEAKKASQHLASGYRWDEDGHKFIEAAFEETRPFSGAGFVISNARDYAKWVKCLLQEEAPFSKATHEDIRTPRIIDSEDPNTVGDISLYGLAWDRTVAHGQVVINHSGTETAYGSQVFWLPDIKFGVVAFANAADTANSAAQVLIWELIENKLQVPSADRYNINDRLKPKPDDGSGSDPEDPDDELFPDRPKVPLPSPVKMSDLAGFYHHAGYGTIYLTEQQQGNQTILSADRGEMVEQHGLRLHHVSGNFWNIHVVDSTNSTEAYWAGEFKIGVDGKPTALEVRFSPPGTEADEAPVIYSSIE
ncbi:Beta-lactamase/transpeptidase-like protein [Akanthomyces lecanii RCEF 1005]|uniref:Beta-lactamase/transpeptidase-like protein n=1 Tax=Akanthomyces lecanii RCEF 1005 TaxID=1081108 RepID=A0A168DS00_CORDF|nr:Beta-lactamase/transpeptidase-like protein [Akanthomyces lecanii RCEF 1005]